ncbi:DUF6518 family protein [Streptomyces coeruleorubidus]|jgi:hypothetical protein|uniref:DUF6518 family protein n=1 Tax=Streptomyces coeruleorubidus TaxID=116188 RepID=UPI003804005F
MGFRRLFTERTLSYVVLYSRFPFSLIAALTAGAALGIFVPLLETADAPAGNVANLVLAAGWAWAALAFCMGLSRNSRLESITSASASLISAVIAYYATKLAQGEFLTADLNAPSQGTQVHWYSFLSKAVFWCVAASILGPILGLAGNLARNRGILGYTCRMLVPLVAIAETSERLRVEASLQGAVAGTTWTAILLIAVAVFGVLVGNMVINRQPRHSPGRRQTGA